MNWRSKDIWIEFLRGSRKTKKSHIRISISRNPFFSQGIVMSFYGIAGLFMSSYLWCTIFWNVGSGYDQFDRKKGIVCIFVGDFLD
ncbi:hypothetical protein LUZ63_022396 [Rhynchospora breviuscula]|uniref:Photosystem I assembly protein Ycf4 n=1 Tax=Rhynchospora breviuscula TaxID=2022672 RepID=A0A9Q0BZ39_9POAL|nr:hypothetical protein LUZ63_022396 [Rhynchospora breviuscula]